MTMNTNAKWNLDLVDGLGFEARFRAAQLKLPSAAEKRFVKPSLSESRRAAANIRDWRSYLPEACIARMLDDGWQWST
jgi:hypothetical protein